MENSKVGASDVDSNDQLINSDPPNGADQEEKIPTDENIELRKEDGATGRAPDGYAEADVSERKRPSKQRRKRTKKAQKKDDLRPESSSLKSSNGGGPPPLGIRNSLIMKTKGSISYKKKGTFSQWKQRYAILDDKSQQMNLFKSQEDYSKLARCKITIDIALITKIKPIKRGLLRSNFPFVVYRRAGLSPVKLAADNEDDRAKWITTIEEMLRVVKESTDQYFRSQKLISEATRRNSSGGTSSNSESCATSSTAEPEEPLIRAKKLVSPSGFKVDSSEISSVRLKRASSERNKEIKEDHESELTPQEKFGVKLRRVNTENPPPPHSEREQSPEYIEFKRKYQSLSLSRKNNADPKIPLKNHSVCSNLVGNINKKEFSSPNLDTPRSPNLDTPRSPNLDTPRSPNLDTPRRGGKEVSRNRSPSPKIPISKGVETVMKNKEFVSIDAEELTSSSSSSTQIHHAREDVVPRHDSVIEEMKHGPEEVEEGVSNSAIEVEECEKHAPNERCQDEVIDAKDVEKRPRHITVVVIKEEKDLYEASKEVSDSSFASLIETTDTSELTDVVTFSTFDYNSLVETNIRSDSVETSQSHESELSLHRNDASLQVTPSDTSLSRDPPITNSELHSLRETSPFQRTLDGPDQSLRLSTDSVGSQGSTESDEPLPQLNFLGEYEGAKTPEEPEGEEHLTRMRERPESSGSPVCPEFTVVQENLMVDSKAPATDVRITREEPIHGGSNEGEMDQIDGTSDLHSEPIRLANVETAPTEKTYVNHIEMTLVKISKSLPPREDEEESDYFPSYEAEVPFRNRPHPPNPEEDVRISGIAGLKRFLREHQMDSTLEGKGGISKLGHSPAIEKLREEIQK